MVKQVSPGIHLITTAPSLTVCRRAINRHGEICKRPVLAATVGGLDRHVDTGTLNEIGELAALVSGRATFELVSQDYLVRRTVSHINAGPARHPVLAQHDCTHIPESHIDHAWTIAAKALIFSALGATVPTDVGAQPPF